MSMPSAGPPARSSRSPISDRGQAPAALVPAYAAKRERTYRLVAQAVDALRQARARVSIATIVARSTELDADGKGVTKDVVLGNANARAWCEAHRTQPVDVAAVHGDQGTSALADRENHRRECLAY
jgi:hypothetical protein